MPTRRRTTNLSLDEIAILTTTNDIETMQPGNSGMVVLSTKEAYLWAVLFSDLAQKGNDNQDWFLDRFRAVLSQYAEALHERCSELIPNNTIPVAFFSAVATDCHAAPYIQLHARALRAYESLVRRGLIVDPFKKRTATALLAVWGLIPTGFTSTTDKGHQVKTVSAPFYEVLDDKSPHSEYFEVHTRFEKIAKDVYPKMTDIMDDVLFGGQQPKAQPKRPKSTGHGKSKG